MPLPPVIDARDVTVRYRVTGERNSRRSDLLSRLRSRRSPYLALDSARMTVGYGEMFFLVGRNGAGKSTMLKVLAQTLVPDSGSVTYRGRVTSFLSMGLGFQENLTGDQNLDFALTLMGVPDRDIPEKREEINAFTSLGAFMQMPVSSYSAGMRTRLGFAIATSLEPDILIMDEILNAGDKQFRDAAEQRLELMMSKAKAIVIATHDTQQVLDRGHRAAWFEAGRVCAIGDPRDVVHEYNVFVSRLKDDPDAALHAQNSRFE